MLNPYYFIPDTDSGRLQERVHSSFIELLKKIKLERKYQNFENTNLALIALNNTLY